jgi:hypothetical protein
MRKQSGIGIFVEGWRIVQKRGARVAQIEVTPSKWFIFIDNFTS